MIIKLSGWPWRRGLRISGCFLNIQVPRPTGDPLSQSQEEKHKPSVKSSLGSWCAAVAAPGTPFTEAFPRQWYGAGLEPSLPFPVPCLEGALYQGVRFLLTLEID